MAATKEEHANWGYLWSQMQWKRQLVVVSPGKLQAFPSQQRDQAERKLLLNGASVRIVESTESGKASLENIHKSHFWRKLTRSSCTTTQNLPEPEGAILIVKSRDGKKLFILASDQEEAEKWKVEIEKAISRTVPQRQRSSNKFLRVLSLSSAASKSGNQPTLQKKKQLALRWEDKGSVDRPVESPLGGLESLRDCTTFLKSSSNSQHAFEVAMCMIDHFNGSYQMGGCSLSNELRIEAWKGTLLTIVRTLRDELLVAGISATENDSEKLWLACEAWVMAAAHDKIMGACKQMFAVNDRELAVILSKLRQVDPSLLGVGSNLKDIAFGEAIHVFGMINSYRTPLEKAVCLRRTVNSVLDGIQAAKDDKLPCTDDLLSLMLLLMSHAKVQHLQATACYMENFFQLREQNSGELGYHITNFVAACSYLSSPEIKDLVSDVILSPSSTTSSSPGSSSSSSSSRSHILDQLDASSRSTTDPYLYTGASDSSPEFLLASTYL